MKKSFILLIALALIFFSSACTNNLTEKKTLAMDSLARKEAVKGWSTYTNPAFRYELRYPTDWEVMDSGEDGLVASFYSKERKAEVKKNKETFYGSLIFIAYPNWEKKYDLDTFYRQREENLFLGNYEQEEVEIDGEQGIWFKGVRSKNPEKPDQLVDLIALDLDDRILEIEIHEEWDTARTIINSINFYPAKVISDLK